MAPQWSVLLAAPSAQATTITQSILVHSMVPPSLYRAAVKPCHQRLSNHAGHLTLSSPRCMLRCSANTTHKVGACRALLPKPSHTRIQVSIPALTMLLGMQGCAEEVRARMQPLGQAQVGSACSAWLESLGTHLARQRAGALGACSTATQLADLEAAVQEGLSQWQAEDSPEPAALPGVLGWLSV